MARKKITDDAPTDEMLTDEVPADEVPADEVLVDEVSADEVPVDKFEAALPVEHDVHVPVAGAMYRAREQFTAQIGAQLCSFPAGAELDSLAGALLVAGGAPVDIVAG